MLLYGPPGTGKTLLARAVAGEAGVPFYSISGSDFVEMFVGVGASRVRDLFEQAKANAPAIIFVDEIDAVGRHRGAGMGGGHDEREQTLNQLLVEMDGFDVKGGVILIAATNRPDILDPALLRPGPLRPPDRRRPARRHRPRGRAEGARQGQAVRRRRRPRRHRPAHPRLHRRRPRQRHQRGRAAHRAQQRPADHRPQALEESIDRVIAGPERKTRAMSDKEKRVTAYHEAGHALTAWAMPNLDPVHKVTILPRGRSLGHTLVLPLEDRYTQTRAEILDQLVYALGGRAAEELVFHEPTTGASNDIEKATKLARAMVTEYGMSTKLGAVKYGTGDAEPFMGRDYGHQRDYSEDIAADIDAEVRDLIEGAHDEAWEILQQYRDALDAMVLELVEKETLAKDDLERILGAGAQAPAAQHVQRFGKRTPSDRPPVDIPPSLRKPRRTGSANGGRATADRPSARPTAAGAPARRRARPERAAAAAPGPGGGAFGPTGGSRRLTASGLRRRSGARRGGGPRAAVSRSARTPTARGCGPRRPGSRGLRRDRSPACTSTRTTCCRPPSTSTTTSSSWSRTSRCTRPASTTWCPGTARAAVGYIPGDGRPDHRAVQAGPGRRPLRPPPAGAGAADRQVADAVMTRLEPRGVIVVVEAEHLCMAMRGVRKPGSMTMTSAVRGIFKDDPRTRAEALSLILGR